MTPGRRSLRFESLDEVLPEVERLAAGHRVVGNWSLARICRHLASAMRRVVDLPPPETPDTSLWVPPEVKKATFETRILDEGLPAPPEIVPPEVDDLAAEMDGLRRAIEHYRASAGPRIPHRFFGYLTKEEWDKLQLIHFAHHLSFVVPVKP